MSCSTLLVASTVTARGALAFDGESEPRMDGALHLGGVAEAPALIEGAKIVFNA